EEAGRNNAQAHRAFIHRAQHGRARGHQRDPRAFGRVRQGRHSHAPLRGSAVGARAGGSGRRRSRNGQDRTLFTLMRFVLASPDVPAETLLADRANFLASSLRRFREAYLFSSEGDEVLRLISTTVNYFTFPTASRNYGYRLGNTEILRSSFGAAPDDQEVLTTLRVG